MILAFQQCPRIIINAHQIAKTSRVVNLILAQTVPNHYRWETQGIVFILARPACRTVASHPVFRVARDCQAGIGTIGFVGERAIIIISQCLGTHSGVLIQIIGRVFGRHPILIGANAVA